MNYEVKGLSMDVWRPVHIKDMRMALARRHGIQNVDSLIRELDEGGTVCTEFLTFRRRP